MSATLVPMPRLSDSMEEGTVVRWLKAPGDVVARGDALVEIETDKATMVYEAEEDGILGEQLVAEGEVAALGAPIAHLLTEGGRRRAAGARQRDAGGAARRRAAGRRARAPDRHRPARADRARRRPGGRAGRPAAAAGARAGAPWLAATSAWS